MTRRDGDEKRHGLSPDLLAQILLGINSGVIALDAHDHIALVNPAAIGHLGPRGAALKPGAALAAQPELAPFQELIDELNQTHTPISRREITVEGEEEERVLGVTASPLFDETGALSGKVFVFSDLTRVRALERQAELNAQLAQIGELTAGVVHELRNPLSVISGLAELLQRKLQDNERLANNAAVIVEEVGNLDRLIRDFLVFSKPYEIEKSICEPAQLAARTQKQVERLARDHAIRLNLIIEDALPRIAADGPKLVQALSNLVRNAIEVSPPGGEVLLRVGHDDGEVSFEVADQGPGIDPAIGRNIFDPFYSKKSGGTGLGLSIVHRIVTGHGGAIGYRNRESGGAVFEIRLRA